MKIRYIYILAILLVVTGWFTSCDDIVTYDDNYDEGMSSNGVPQITSIFGIDDLDRETPISEGAFEEIIVLQGSNLSGLESVFINDVEVNTSEVYTTSTEAYFPIPKIVPGNVTNKIYYKTRLGSTSYDFIVNIPAIQISGLYNEFALPGSSVQVVGKYFDLYGFGGDNANSTIKMNGVDLEIDSLTEQYMSIIIPLEAADDATIDFSWVGAEGAMNYKVPYRPVSSIVWDLSHPDDYGFWAGTQYITDGTAENEPEALNGPYFRVNGTYASWSWNTLLCGGFNMSEEIAANPSDYLLKFDVNTASGTPFYSSGTAGYLIKINSGSYAWNPSGISVLNTYGSWKTISLELADVATKGLKSGWVTMNWIMQPNSEWVVDHSFANIRIEKK